MADAIIAGLRQAMPYLRLYRGQTFVVKFGGEILANESSLLSLLEQVAVLTQLGIKVALVHGGGPQATEMAGRLGAKSEFIEGRRVTDAGMLEAMIATLNGTARTQLLAACQKLKIKAVGISGVDAGTVVASKRPAKEGLDYGFVGDIEAIRPEVIRTLLDEGALVIVSPLCANEDGQVLNVNADVVAAAIAVALKATKLVLVTSTRGILQDITDASSLISEITVEHLRKLETDGILRDGMMPKAASIAAAIDGGVERVHVIGHQYPDSILTEIFTNEGCGTMVTC